MIGRTFLHASCVLIGEAGVLIRGTSGAGKSRLARGLMTEAARRGLLARLIGDDRVEIEPAGGRLIVRGHAAVAGLIEARGLGILAEAPESACVARLIVDLIGDPEPRLPAEDSQQAVLAEVVLPLLTLGPDADRPDLVLAAVLRLSSQKWGPLLATSPRAHVEALCRTP
jgi:HPr kinase/phosphorylase